MSNAPSQADLLKRLEYEIAKDPNGTITVGSEAFRILCPVLLKRSRKWILLDCELFVDPSVDRLFVGYGKRHENNKNQFV